MNQRISIWWVFVGFIMLFCFIKQCESEPKIVVKTETKIVKVSDTITEVEIKQIPKIVYVDKIKTVKGKDSIIYKDKASDTTTKANLYDAEVKTKDALAKLKITTTGELLDVSGVITYPKEINTVTITKTRNASGLFIYANLPITNFQSPEVGVLLQIKNKMFVSSGMQYNNFTKKIDFKVGLGVKIW